MWHKIKKFVLYFVLIVFGVAFVIYGILWAFSFKKYNVTFGVSFSPNYATSLGLDWKTTYQAILKDLKPKYIRVAAPWSEVEKQKDIYSYKDVDYMMNEADKRGVKVLLEIGQKSPRWPECYFPDWTTKLSVEDKKTALFEYINKTVLRYAKNPALESWQVENEPFINFDFGFCAGYNESAVKDEVALVHKLDIAHKTVITDSGELSTWYTASHTGDILGVTLYRIVRTPTNMIWRYTYMPSGTYRLRADMFGESFDSFYVSELQAEPWFNGGTPLNTPIATQEETMNPDILNGNIKYATEVGASRAYFWGAEWWYFMKTKNNDSRYWDIGREVL